MRDGVGWALFVLRQLEREKDRILIMDWLVTAVFFQQRFFSSLVLIVFLLVVNVILLSLNANFNWKKLI